MNLIKLIYSALPLCLCIVYSCESSDSLVKNGSKGDEMRKDRRITTEDVALYYVHALKVWDSSYKKIISGEELIVLKKPHDIKLMKLGEQPEDKSISEDESVFVQYAVGSVFRGEASHIDGYLRVYKKNNMYEGRLVVGTSDYPNMQVIMYLGEKMYE